MNGTSAASSGTTHKVASAKSPLTSQPPPAPTSAPPVPGASAPNGTHPPRAYGGTGGHQQNTNGTHASHAQVPKSKTKREPAAVDHAFMYESVKNRIAALEEEEVVGEEEERMITEEAHASVKGLEETAIHTKYIDLFTELKRVERDHAKEKQKLVKDKDSAKSQLTKANQTKAKMENLARELQKDNKKLREDARRLAQSADEAEAEINQLKVDLSKRAEKVKIQEGKYRDSPDLVVKVVCMYRAELFFKISRKTKFQRLFNAWTERMEQAKTNGPADGFSRLGTVPAQYIFTHRGRPLEADQTPDEALMDEGDEILAVEMMDLTGDEAEEVPEVQRQKLRKNWTEDPQEARRAVTDIFDGIVRERLKEVLHHYQLREHHFECVIRSKELEVLLSRARAAEQRQLAEADRARAERAEDEMQRLKKEMDDFRLTQQQIIDRLVRYGKEQPERTHQMFLSFLDEIMNTKKEMGRTG